MTESDKRTPLSLYDATTDESPLPLVHGLSGVDRLHLDLLHVKRGAQLAMLRVAGMDKEAFLRNRTIQEAVSRHFSTMGEAATRISKYADKFQKTHSDLPWRQMRRMRNMVDHTYDNVDQEIIWSVIQNNLPDLVAKVDALPYPLWGDDPLASPEVEEPPPRSLKYPQKPLEEKKRPALSLPDRIMKLGELASEDNEKAVRHMMGVAKAEKLSALHRVFFGEASYSLSLMVNSYDPLEAREHREDAIFSYQRGFSMLKEPLAPEVWGTAMKHYGDALYDAALDEPTTRQKQERLMGAIGVYDTSAGELQKEDGLWNLKASTYNAAGMAWTKLTEMDDLEAPFRLEAARNAKDAFGQAKEALLKKNDAAPETLRIIDSNVDALEGVTKRLQEGIALEKARSHDPEKGSSSDGYDPSPGPT